MNLIGVALVALDIFRMLLNSIIEKAFSLLTQYGKLQELGTQTPDVTL